MTRVEWNCWDEDARRCWVKARWASRRLPPGRVYGPCLIHDWTHFDMERLGRRQGRGWRRAAARISERMAAAVMKAIAG